MIVEHVRSETYHKSFNFKILDPMRLFTFKKTSSQKYFMVSKRLRHHILYLIHKHHFKNYGKVPERFLIHDISGCFETSPEKDSSMIEIESEETPPDPVKVSNKIPSHGFFLYNRDRFRRNSSNRGGFRRNTSRRNKCKKINKVDNICKTFFV